MRGTAGHCVVGLAPTPMIWDVITNAVADCACAFPDVDVAVEDVATPRQPAALREARIDLAIGHHHPSFSELDPNIARVGLLPDFLNSAFASDSRPLAKKREVSLRDLGDLPFLFMNRAFSPSFYDQVMSSFAQANYTPCIEGAYDGLPTVWALAAQGLGWCVAGESQRAFPPKMSLLRLCSKCCAPSRMRRARSTMQA